MKRACSPLLLLLALLTGSRLAKADDAYLCCDIAANASSGPCTASSTPCSGSAPYALQLSNLSASGAGDFPLPPGAVGASFPSGVDGYLSLNMATPRLGICLDAPAPSDPSHEGPTEPAACLTLSLASGISGGVANVTVPLTGQWDGYQFCYGAPSGGLCQNANDLDDPTIATTPMSGSCCGPAHLLAGGPIVTGQEIPGVPPPVVVFGSDGGVVAYYLPDAGDSLGSVPDACAVGYGQASNCGAAPPGGGAGPDSDASSCVPISCSAEVCGTIQDGCGGMLHCQDCSKLAQGKLSCTAAPGAPADATRGLGILFALLGFAGLERRRRARRLA